MLISTQTTLALRCPSCGKMDLYALSRFACAGGANSKVMCECGTCLLSYCQKGRNVVRLQVECLMCETKHVYSYKNGELWNGSVITIKCENTGMEIGFLGPKDLVMMSVRQADRSLREMADELGYDKYFINTDIMYQVLEILRKMAGDGRMSCGCGGSQLEVEVYPDRVELSCSACDAVGIVFAETVKDLQWVHTMESVQLEAHTYRYLDQKRNKKQTPINKK